MMRSGTNLTALTSGILGAFHDAYSGCGYGMSESVCGNAFSVALQARNISFEREVRIELVFKGVAIGAFRLDFLIENRVIAEIKAAKQLSEADQLQILNYLRKSPYELGFLLHFGPKRDFKRFIYTNDRKTF
jgi:GxxExxY protein